MDVISHGLLEEDGDIFDDGVSLGMGEEQTNPLVGLDGVAHLVGSWLLVQLKGPEGHIGEVFPLELAAIPVVVVSRSENTEGARARSPKENADGPWSIGLTQRAFPVPEELVKLTAMLEGDGGLGRAGSTVFAGIIE